MESGKHFVLVHGLCHGAWYWYKIVSRLKSDGHRVTALDLGACGVNPKRFDEVVSLSEYLQPLMDFMASLSEDDKVILVGHSYGGLSVSIASEAFPKKIIALVFLTAFMPTWIFPPAVLVQEFFKRTPVETLLDCQVWFDDGSEEPPTSLIFGPKFLATNIYQNCQSEEQELGTLLLTRGRLFLKDLAKESLVTEERFGSVNRVFIICEADEALKEEFQRWFIDNNPTKDVRVMAGADHMAMLSKPTELCQIFQEIAEKYH